MKPAPSASEMPSAVSPRPFMWECGAIRDERDADVVDGGGKALCATGVEEVDGLPDIVTVVKSKRR